MPKLRCDQACKQTKASKPIPWTQLQQMFENKMVKDKRNNNHKIIHCLVIAKLHFQQYQPCYLALVESLQFTISN